jgi:hydroxymethylglutaryl-CoA lyase
MAYLWGVHALNANMIQLVECPRDAMQGIKSFIPTAQKVDYIKQLMKVGFHTIDFGSFVSPKAIPQMQDTAEVLRAVEEVPTKSQLLAIVANVRGAVDACQFDRINAIGYPFSISETFQLRNTNATISESLGRTEAIIALCERFNKEAVIYLSMGFGNPYGDPWSPEIASEWVEKLALLGAKTISVSDTVGVASAASIASLFNELKNAFPQINFGAHLHTTADTWLEKVDAAYTNGCTRFDGAILGFGGCPMAKDELVGNMPMEKLLQYFGESEVKLGLDLAEFQLAKQMAISIFNYLN